MQRRQFLIVARALLASPLRPPRLAGGQGR